MHHLSLFPFRLSITTALPTFRLLRPGRVLWEHTAVLLSSLLERFFEVRLMTLEGVEWLVSTSCQAFCCVKEERNGMEALGGRGPGIALRARNPWRIWSNESSLSNTRRRPRQENER
ncbi:hypothetical protein DFP72DRAFT_275502 [Ephemerocybe angulata]|uniref:Uncharacterized protein n=1 Tax=Ephemerocybe angulata TaxID=980116 RepID=A0A8H6I2K3_9AGAR|nr:hypothetical protein DFP72DRAFT_275502 [Tulosesus angulatus]